MKTCTANYGDYALIPGTKLHDFTETAVLEFLNGKQARNSEIVIKTMV